jgi:hypothetical protein
MISPTDGAMIDDRIDWWGGRSPPGRDFPYYIGRVWCVAGPDFDSAENLIRSYPKIAEQCLGGDREYVEWYRDMLQTTAPDGVIYAHDYSDPRDPRPIDRMRVLGVEGEVNVLVPLPPPGKGGWLPEPQILHEVPPRITHETIGQIVAGMAFSEVRDLLGAGEVLQKGESVQRTVAGTCVKITTAALKWQEGERWITITFRNDKVVKKHHSGVE